ncbi:MAG TPA: hypothetical protein VFN71_01865 [Methylomirabilota bacterium]|nr:hypothetical protein [Methylomirabilota bacterium]
MRSFLRVAMLLSALVVWGAPTAGAQDGLTRRDARGPVTVAVTLLAPPVAGAPLKARIALDTHSVDLDVIALERAVAIRMADGTEVPPTAVEDARGAGHHRQAVLVFPPPGPGPVRIVVRDVGEVAERSFSWDVPSAR